MIYGLTGGIAMGKSTLTEYAREMGIPVWCADSAVHRLYSENWALIRYIEERYPSMTQNDRGQIDRAALSAHLFAHPNELEELSKIVLVELMPDLTEFLADNADRVCILDVPLLFEKQFDGFCDEIIVVSCPLEVQRERCLARPNMTEEKFEQILSGQWTDAQRRERAHHIIDSTLPVEDMTRQFVAIFG